MEILVSASQHQHLHWHWHCKKTIFAVRIFFFKVEYLCSFLCLAMVSVPLCYKYLVLYGFVFIQSKASIDVLEKSYLNIWKHPSWCFLKKNGTENFCIVYILSSKTSRIVFLLSTLIGLPEITPKVLYTSFIYAVH